MSGQAVNANSARPPAPEPVDVAVVGAGIAGLYAIYRLRELGFSIAAFEAGGEIGGTWYWNRYPGARCDVASMWYSYSFSDELQQDWNWREKYATQPEILQYLNHVADRFGLRRHIRFNTRVVAAKFDDRSARWAITTEHGDTVAARFCVLASGILSTPKVPELAGLREFSGKTYYTALWPEVDPDFSGQRVAVIGTGSSGVQSIPIIAEEAEHLTVFQRTPNFCLPARNEPLDASYVANIKAKYPQYREAARDSEFGVPLGTLASDRASEISPHGGAAAYEERWQRSSLFCFSDLDVDILSDLAANQMLADFVRGKMKEQVDDPATAELLLPRAHPYGTKRTCLETGYLPTYNKANVELVDLPTTPILELTASGILTSAREHQVDSIVFATGFDAMTGAVLSIDIEGRGSQRLADRWSEGPRAYLGLCVAGFPNMFIVTGPGSPSALSNMFVSIEQHIDWLARCMEFMASEGYDVVEATLGAEADWVRHVDQLAHETLYPMANTWYLGANIPGKPRVFMAYAGGVDRYRRTCDEVEADHYRGLALTAARVSAVDGGKRLRQNVSAEVSAASTQATAARVGGSPTRGRQRLRGEGRGQ
jgi:cation diffusion facilitator CzcD-associated flavoprotein CzcO